jgi:hypothetical protein
VSGLWGPAKGCTSLEPWRLNWHTIKAEKVAARRIKEGAEGERTCILICEVEQVRGRGALGQEKE